MVQSRRKIIVTTLTFNPAMDHRRRWFCRIRHRRRQKEKDECCFACFALYHTGITTSHNAPTSFVAATRARMQPW